MILTHHTDQHQQRREWGKQREDGLLRHCAKHHRRAPHVKVSDTIDLQDMTGAILDVRNMLCVKAMYDYYRRVQLERARIEMRFLQWFNLTRGSRGSPSKAASRTSVADACSGKTASATPVTSSS